MMDKISLPSDSQDDHYLPLLTELSDTRNSNPLDINKAAENYFKGNNRLRTTERPRKYSVEKHEQSATRPETTWRKFTGSTDEAETTHDEFSEPSDEVPETTSGELIQSPGEKPETTSDDLTELSDEKPETKPRELSKFSEEKQKTNRGVVLKTSHPYNEAFYDYILKPDYSYEDFYEFLPKNLNDNKVKEENRKPLKSILKAGIDDYQTNQELSEKSNFPLPGILEVEKDYSESIDKHKMKFEEVQSEDKKGNPELENIEYNEQIHEFANLLPDYINIMVDLMENLGDEVQMQSLNEQLREKLFFNEINSLLSKQKEVEKSDKSEICGKTCPCCNVMKDTLPIVQQAAQIGKDVCSNVPNVSDETSSKDKTQEPLHVCSEQNKTEEIETETTGDIKETTQITEVTQDKKYVLEPTDTDFPYGLFREIRKDIHALPPAIEQMVQPPIDIHDIISPNNSVEPPETHLILTTHPEKLFHADKPEVEIFGSVITNPPGKVSNEILSQKPSPHSIATSSSENILNEKMIHLLCLDSAELDSDSERDKLDELLCLLTEEKGGFKNIVNRLSPRDIRTKGNLIYYPLNTEDEHIKELMQSFLVPPKPRRKIRKSKSRGLEGPFHATEKLKAKIEQLKEAQGTQNMQRFVHRSCDPDGVPVNGRSWLRTWLFSKVIKRLREDEWRKTYVKGEDDDLGEPVWMLLVENPNHRDSIFPDLFNVFGSFKSWYFTRRIRAYQKKLDAKEHFFD